MDTWSKIIGVVGLIIAIVAFAYFLKDRYWPKGFKLHIDYKNTFISPLIKEDNTIGDKLYLGIYGLKIANLNNKSVTIKDVELGYMLNGTEHKYESYVLKTGTLKNGKMATMQTNGPIKIIIAGWENLRSKLGEHNVLVPGAVLDSSALFPLQVKKDELSKLTDIKLIITDYSGNTSTHKIILQEDFLKGIKKGFSLLDRNFIQKDDDSFEFL